LTPELRKDLTVHLVSSIDEVLALALQPISSDTLPVEPKGRTGDAHRKGRSPRTLSPSTPA
ncbi:MAG: hypothetical protein AB7O32_18025, partial [Vicinamibacterales bacterium]